MILLDTDHFSIVSDRDNSRHAALLGKVQAAVDERLAVPVVSVIEQLQGWLAVINRQQDTNKQVPAYARLLDFLQFLRTWEIVPFDGEAAAEFQRLRKQRIRIGTQDLKIAAIALVQNALLLSANLRDYTKVPGLRVANWLE